MALAVEGFPSLKFLPWSTQTHRTFFALISKTKQQSVILSRINQANA